MAAGFASLYRRLALSPPHRQKESRVVVTAWATNRAAIFANHHQARARTKSETPHEELPE
jgi:hypothetical protein